MQNKLAIASAIIMFLTAGFVSIILFVLNDMMSQHEPELYDSIRSFRLTIVLLATLYLITAILVATIPLQKHGIRIFSWSLAVLYHGGLIGYFALWTNVGMGIIVFGFFEFFAVLFCIGGLSLALYDLHKKTTAERAPAVGPDGSHPANWPLLPSVRRMGSWISGHSGGKLTSRPGLILIILFLALAGVAWHLASDNDGRILIVLDREITEAELGTASQAHQEAKIARIAEEAFLVEVTSYLGIKNNDEEFADYIERGDRHPGIKVIYDDMRAHYQLLLQALEEVVVNQKPRDAMYKKYLDKKMIPAEWSKIAGSLDNPEDLDKFRTQTENETYEVYRTRYIADYRERYPYALILEKVCELEPVKEKIEETIAELKEKRTRASSARARDKPIAIGYICVRDAGHWLSDFYQSNSDLLDSRYQGYEKYLWFLQPSPYPIE